MIEYKTVSVGGVTKVKDEGKGVVTAIVSVTGIEDNVKDVILPGAYKDTLTKRKPKGAWGHDWKSPTAKTLSIQELEPGHKELPDKLPNGQAWPKDAGALKVRMKFNLGSTRGRDAYSDVMFFKDEQEWSIGYSVPKDGSYKRDGVRYIKKLDLYEYSPVLFGAMPHARTATVKDAQLSFKTLNGATVDEVKEWENQLIEFKAAVAEEIGESADSAEDFEGDGDPDEMSDEEFYDDEEVEDEEEDDGEEDEKSDDVVAYAREMIAVAEKMLLAAGESLEGKEDDMMMLAAMGQQAYIEAKASTATSVADAAYDTDDSALQEAAEAFDAAAAAEDPDRLEKAATDVLDLVEKAIRESDLDDVDDLHVVATVVSDVLQDLNLDANGSTNGKSVTIRGVQFKGYEYSVSARDFGTVIDAKDRLAMGPTAGRAYVKMLDDDVLLSLKDYLSAMTGEADLKSYVDMEVGSRDLDGKNYDTSGYGEEQEHPMEEVGRKRKIRRPKGRRRDRYEEEEDRRKRGTGRVGNRMEKRDYSASQRETAANRGNALPDGSFPINNKTDLKNAIRLAGNAKDPAAAKAHIKKRARALGCEDLIPDSWKAALANEEKTVTIDVTEFEFKDLDISDSQDEFAVFSVDDL